MVNILWYTLWRYFTIVEEHKYLTIDKLKKKKKLVKLQLPTWEVSIFPSKKFKNKKREREKRKKKKEKTRGREKEEGIREFLEIDSLFNYLVVDGMARRRCIGYDTSALRADSVQEFVEWTAEVAMVLLTFQLQLLPRERLPGAKQCSRSQLLAGNQRQNHRRTASRRVTGTPTWNLTLVFTLNRKALNTFPILSPSVLCKSFHQKGV